MSFLVHVVLEINGNILHVGQREDSILLFCRKMHFIYAIIFLLSTQLDFKQVQDGSGWFVMLLSFIIF